MIVCTLFYFFIFLNILEDDLVCSVKIVFKCHWDKKKLVAMCMVFCLKPDSFDGITSACMCLSQELLTFVLFCYSYDRGVTFWSIHIVSWIILSNDGNHMFNVYYILYSSKSSSSLLDVDVMCLKPNLIVYWLIFPYLLELFGNYLTNTTPLVLQWYWFIYIYVCVCVHTEMYSFFLI